MFFSKSIIFNTCSLNDSQKLFHAVFTSAYMFIFCTIKFPYQRHLIITGNMFAYFCCGLLFRIIFTSFYTFNQSLKICINNKLRLIRFLVLVKLLYFSIFRKHYNTTKILKFCSFLVIVIYKRFNFWHSLLIVFYFFKI